jgi:hypothetical protein
MNAKRILFAVITLIFTSAMGQAQTIDEASFWKRVDAIRSQLQTLGEEDKLPRTLEERDLLVQKIVDTLVPLDGRVGSSNSVAITFFNIGNSSSAVKKLVSHIDAIKNFLDDSQLAEDSKAAAIESLRTRASRKLAFEVHNFLLPGTESDESTESPVKLADKTNDAGNELVAALRNSSTN